MSPMAASDAATDNEAAVRWDDIHPPEALVEPDRAGLLVLPLRLNLGSGRDHRPTMLNVDHVSANQTDLAWDLNDTPWPFPTDSTDHVLMDNVLEHLADPVAALDELARILQPDGTAELIVPHYQSPAAYHPDHRSYWSLESLNAWIKGDFGGTKGLDAPEPFDLIVREVMHKRPHGLWLGTAIPLLKPQKLRFVIRRRKD